MYKIAIRNNKTGEVRIAVMDVEWWEHSFFWWTEGNMCCDCNRHLEFGRVEDPEFCEDIPCSEERYTVLYAELGNGERIPLDTATDEEYHELINPEDEN